MNAVVVYESVYGNTRAIAEAIAKRLRRHGYDVVGSESFLVEDSEGPLEQGELDRARAWGAQLASAAGGTGGTSSAGGADAAGSAAGASAPSSREPADSREAGR